MAIGDLAAVPRVKESEGEDETRLIGRLLQSKVEELTVARTDRVIALLLYKRFCL